jgi:hypothetical protein
VFESIHTVAIDCRLTDQYREPAQNIGLNKYATHLAQESSQRVVNRFIEECGFRS